MLPETAAARREGRVRKRVQIRKRSLVAILYVYVRLADLSEAYATVQLGDLEHSLFKETLNGSDASLSIDGAERLDVAVDDADAKALPMR